MAERTFWWHPPYVHAASDQRVGLQAIALCGLTTWEIPSLPPRPVDCPSCKQAEATDD